MYKEIKAALNCSRARSQSNQGTSLSLGKRSNPALVYFFRRLLLITPQANCTGPVSDMLFADSVINTLQYIK